MDRSCFLPSHYMGDMTQGDKVGSRCEGMTRLSSYHISVHTNEESHTGCNPGSIAYDRNNDSPQEIPQQGDDNQDRAIGQMNPLDWQKPISWYM